MCRDLHALRTKRAMNTHESIARAHLARLPRRAEPPRGPPREPAAARRRTQTRARRRRRAGPSSTSARARVARAHDVAERARLAAARVGARAAAAAQRGRARDLLGVRRVPRRLELARRGRGRAAPRAGARAARAFSRTWFTPACATSAAFAARCCAS